MDNYILLLGLVAIVALYLLYKSNETFENDDKDKLLLDLITYVLEKGHYHPKDINDDFSVKVFEDFIDGFIEKELESSSAQSQRSDTYLDESKNYRDDYCYL